MDRYRILFSRLLVLLLMAALAGCASNAPAPEQMAPVHRPEQSKQWAQEGRQALEAGNREVALRAWQKSLAADPANATVRNNLALLLNEQKRFDEAAQLLEAGLAVTPEVPDLHYNLAVISELYLLDLDTALKHYRQYQALGDDDSQNVAGWIADLERRLQ